MSGVEGETLGGGEAPPLNYPSSTPVATCIAAALVAAMFRAPKRNPYAQMTPPGTVRQAARHTATTKLHKKKRLRSRVAYKAQAPHTGSKKLTETGRMSSMISSTSTPFPDPPSPSLGLGRGINSAAALCSTRPVVFASGTEVVVPPRGTIKGSGVISDLGLHCSGSTPCSPCSSTRLIGEPGVGLPIALLCSDGRSQDGIQTGCFGARVSAGEPVSRAAGVLSSSEVMQEDSNTECSVAMASIFVCSNQCACSAQVRFARARCARARCAIQHPLKHIYTRHTESRASLSAA